MLLASRLKHYAEENKAIVRCEALRADIRRKDDRFRHHCQFFHPFQKPLPLQEHRKDSFARIRKNNDPWFKTRHEDAACLVFG